MSFVYAIENELGRIKIGMSNDPSGRLKTFISQSGVEMKLLKKWNVGEHKSCFEEFLHALFNAYHYSGEWFVFEGRDKALQLIDKYHKVFMQVSNKHYGICARWGIDREMRSYLPEGAISHKYKMRLKEANLNYGKNHSV